MPSGTPLYMSIAGDVRDRIAAEQLGPHSLLPSLRSQLERVRALHEEDLEAGFGEVYLPEALERKFPSASREWGWQWVFPAARRSLDRRANRLRRHHVSEGSIQRAVRRAAGSAVSQLWIAESATTARVSAMLEPIARDIPFGRG